MSGMRHATISAWKREEDGSYAAELHGWTLHVRWHPESAASRRGFTWSALAHDGGSAPKPPAEGSKVTSDEVFEEIELAMADAEAHVEPQQDPPHDAPHDAGGHH